MADLVLIGIAIETRQAETAATRLLTSLNKLEKQADSTVAAFKKIGLGSSTVAGELMGATGATASLAGGLNAVRGVTLLATGALATFGGALLLIAKRGIEVNETLESSTIGIAALIASLNTLKQNDIELKGLDALNAALPIAEEHMRKLRIAGLQTAATTETLVDAFQQALGAGSAAGLSLEQIRNFTIDIVQAAGALKVPYQQISQEVRTILEGTIDQNARIAKALGLTNAMVKNYKEQGTLAEELNKRLEVFRASGERVAKTFAGVTSNAREAFDVFAGTSTGQAFSTITTRLQSVIESVIDTKALDINERLKPVAAFFDEIATGAVTRLFDFVDNTIDLLKDVGDVLRENKELVAQLEDNFRLVEDQIGGVFQALTSGGGDGKAVLLDLNQEMEDLATIIAGTRDGAELLWAAFIGGIKSVELGILGPLKSALGVFGVEIDGLNNKVESLLEGLGEVEKRLGEGRKNLNEVNAKIQENAERAAAVKQFNELPSESRRGVANFLRQNDFELAPGASVPEPKKTASDRINNRTTVTSRRKAPDDKNNAREKKEAEREAKALAEAQLTVRKALSEQTFELEDDRLNREQRLLKTSYDQRLITTEAFFRDKSALEQADLQNEIDRIDSLISAEKEKQKIEKKASDRVKIDNEIIDLQTKKIVLENQLGDIQEANFDAYFESLAKRATEEKKRQDQVADEIAEIQRRRDADRTPLLFDKLDTATRRIQVDQELGLISEEDARKRILGVQREMRDELEKSLQKNLALALLAEDPRAVEQIKQQIEELRTMGVELDNVARLKKALFSDTDTGQLFEDLGRDLRSTVKGAFSDLIKEPENFFSNLVTGFRDALAQMASELLSSTFLKLLRQLFSGTGTSGGGGGGGGFLGGVFGFLSSFIGGLFGGIKIGGGSSSFSFTGAGDTGAGVGFGSFGRAIGGPVTAGMPYPVGERGMEWFIPQTNGRIVSNRDAGKMGGNINVTVNVNGVRNPREFMESSDQIATKLADAIARSGRLK